MQTQRPQAVDCLLFLSDSKASVTGAEGTSGKRFGRELHGVRRIGSYISTAWTLAE